MIVGLGLVAGLRRASIAALQLEHSDADVCTRPPWSSVTRRSCCPSRTAWPTLADWLKVRGAWPGPLLCPVDKAGRVQQAGITPEAIYQAMQKRAEQAGVKAVQPARHAPHVRRKPLDAGVDLVTVQKLMGHSNANTTAGYDRQASGPSATPWPGCT